MNNNSNITFITRPKRNNLYKITDSKKHQIVLFLSDSKSRKFNIDTEINYKFAKVDILGIIIASRKQEIFVETVQRHNRSDSVSDLLIKTVLFDEAKLDYKGLIKIAQKAQRSNAYQKNQNLIISDKAWVESRPYLEIIANDVRCTHGVTIGRIDENQLYYLQTRGLTKNRAEKMLIKGYFEDVIERINDSKIQKDLRKKINTKLKKLL